MKKTARILLLVFFILWFSSMANASLIQYALSGSIPLTREINDPENGSGYEYINLTLNGSCLVSDEDLMPDDPYHNYFNIMDYTISIDGYDFIDEDIAGLIRFCSADVYINMGGGLFSECYALPHELPSSFTVYSSIRPPTDWFSQMDSYADCTFHTMALRFDMTSTPVLEPSTIVLLGSCIPLLTFFRSRLKKNN